MACELTTPFFCWSRGWILSAYVDAVVLLFVSWAAATYIFEAGITPYVFDVGMFVFTTYVVVVNVRVAMVNHLHHRVFQVSTASSLPGHICAK